MPYTPGQIWRAPSDTPHHRNRDTQRRWRAGGRLPGRVRDRAGDRGGVRGVGAGGGGGAGLADARQQFERSPFFERVRLVAGVETHAIQAAPVEVSVNLNHCRRALLVAIELACRRAFAPMHPVAFLEPLGHACFPFWQTLPRQTHAPATASASPQPQSCSRGSCRPCHPVYGCPGWRETAPACRRCWPRPRPTPLSRPSSQHLPHSLSCPRQSILRDRPALRLAHTYLH